MLSYLQERNAWLLCYIPKRPWICSSTERKKIEHIIQIVLWAKIKKKKDRKHIPLLSSWFQRFKQSILLWVILNCTQEAANYILPCYSVISFATDGLGGQTLVWECPENLFLCLPLVHRPHLGDITSAWLGSNPSEVFLLLPRLSLISKTVRTWLKCWVQPVCLFPQQEIYMMDLKYYVYKDWGQFINELLKCPEMKICHLSL